MEENKEKDLAKDIKEDKQTQEKYYENVQLELSKIRLNNVMLEESRRIQENSEQEIVEYGIYVKYKGEDVKIATIDSEGNLVPNEDILQDERFQNDEDKKKLGDMLNLLGLEQDKVDVNKLQEQLKTIEAKTKEEIDKEREDEQNYETSRDDIEEEQGDEENEGEKEIDENANEEEEKENIAEKKHIASGDIFILRENSQLYKNYPQLRKEEPNLYFYRDQDGIIKAEYLDKNGQLQESKFFNNSTTNLKEQTVSLGKDGEDIKKQMPYQVMTTNGLVSHNRETQDVRINIYINQGRMEFEETRQGLNGEWTGYNIEGKGRDYNSYVVNKLSKTQNNKAKPGDISDRYDAVEKTGLSADGVQVQDLSPRKTIERFVDEGYNKKEAIDIYNYMIGEEKLSEDAAKERVNEEIVKEIESGNRSIEEAELDDDQKTPWGDAYARHSR